jgi:predicted GNAT family acetyltransferase
MEFTIKNNTDNLRFELKVASETAFLEYRFYKDSIALVHTVVPLELEGNGIGSALAHYAFEYAKENQFPVMVYCSFVANFLKKHPEYIEQLDKHYHK